MKLSLRISVACLTLLAHGLVSTVVAQQIQKSDLFVAGEGGYGRYHIPGIAVTARGTVLAWCEARRNAGSDWDDIDILLRRSTDSGVTWSPAQRIVEVSGDKQKNPFALKLKSTDPTTVTYNNPVLIADRDGTVHMLFCLEYMRCFYQRSVDDGLTWSRPVEITQTFETFRDTYDWKVLATGPNHGIQLTTSHKHAGRLIVPVWLSTGTGGNAHRPSVTATIYSDDGGKTWQAGDVAVPCTEEFINPNETVAIELADDRVLLNVRNESLAHRRILVSSRDGATGWTVPAFHPDLLEPICMGGTVRYRHADKNLLLFSHPENLSRADGKEVAGRSRDRRNLSVLVSSDEGKSWSVARSIEAGWSAYSDINVASDGTILCFYGRGEKSSFSGDRLTMARFDAQWLLGAGDEPVPESEPERMETDICVFGGTSGGVIAAVQAARMGKRVVLVEPGGHLGGMTSGGLSAVDIGDPRSVGGLAREYFTRLVSHYGKQLQWDQPFRSKGGPATGGAYSIEPNVAEQVFNEMASEAGVLVLLHGRLAAVELNKQRIESIGLSRAHAKLSDITLRARVYVDTTYEGDLMAAAGVDYTLTREANATYGEQYNGIHYAEKYRPRSKHLMPGSNGRVKGGQGVWDRDFPLDPYVRRGDLTSGLLPLVSEGAPGSPGEAAPGNMAYCFRLCLSTAEDRKPIEPPAGYDPNQYELVVRFIEACLANGDHMDLRWFSKHDPLPNQKWDFNTATFGGNLPGGPRPEVAHHSAPSVSVPWPQRVDGFGCWEWPEAGYERRADILKEIENYHRGLLHFLATDSRVPETVRKDMQRFGLPADEFPDTDGWPHQLYIREGRRMVSDLVMTEHHTFGRTVAKHSIGLGSYGTDVHEIRRIVKDGVVTREGKVAGGRGGFGPYRIAFEAIIPKASQCENLLVTFALSASHSAFASIRMEPVFMITSQSAATAAALAIDHNIAVQNIDYQKLRQRLLMDRQVLEWSPN
ncbi:MAG: FAD-dependent oxidoreductase [Planctomycetaceae bacterium]|nr:FAD-dependent oxidoreductase [Planctomycetaceae bacterium]